MLNNFTIIIIGKNAEKFLPHSRDVLADLIMKFNFNIIFVNSGNSHLASKLAVDYGYIELMVEYSNKNSASEARQIGFDYCYGVLNSNNILFLDCDMVPTFAFTDFVVSDLYNFVELYKNEPVLVTYSRVDVDLDDFIKNNLTGRSVSYQSKGNSISRIWGSFILLNVNENLNFFILCPDEEEQVLLSYLKSRKWRIIGVNKTLIYHYGFLNKTTNYIRLLFSKRGLGIWYGLYYSIQNNFFLHFFNSYKVDFFLILIALFLPFFSFKYFFIFLFCLTISRPISVFRLYSLFKFSTFILFNKFIK